MYTRVVSLLLIGQALAQTPISSDLFDKFTRYTTFSSAAYADSCTTPPYGSSVVQYFNDNVTDSQATLFLDTSAQEIILALRGTSTPKDLDTDLLFNLVPLNVAGASCASCKVHEGFQTAYNSLASSITAAINTQLSAHSSFSLTVTGHSLGGGMAAIATASLAGLGKTVTTYTFGEPRNGDPTFATYISSQVPDSRYFRVTHANDGVPQIPPVLLGYTHHGQEYWEKESGTNSASTTVLCGVESTSCNAGQDFGENPINRAHLTYTNGVLGNSLNIVACGAPAS